MSTTTSSIILIADDHPLFRDAISTLVERESDFQVGASVATLDEAIAAAQQVTADIALLDMHMAGMNGTVGIGRLRAAAPSTKIVIVSGDIDPGLVRSSIAAGARGYLPKTFPPDAILAALRLVLTGTTYVPHELAAAANTALPAPTHQPLTPREIQVLSMMARGSSHKEIARELDLAEVTIKLHTKRIVAKLGVKNRSAAIALAIRDGLVQI